MKSKFFPRIPFILDLGKKISKKIVKKWKNYKTSSRHYFLPKRDEIGWKSEHKILLQNPVNTRPGQKNYEKNIKKIQKIRKPLPGIIYSENRTRLAEKVKSKFYSRIPFILEPGKQITKKILKKFKKLEIGRASCRERVC